MLLEHLKSIHILRDLDDASLKSIAHFITPKVFKAGDEILSRDSDSTTVMALCSGLARVTIVSPKGKEIVIRDIKVGEVFGDWSAIDGKPRSASVFAAKDSVVGLITRENFLTLITHNPSIAIYQMQELTSQLRVMTQRFNEFVSMTANLRIQSVLVEMATPVEQGMVIQKMVTHQEIAARAHTQREVVVRELAKLQSQGLLVKNGGGFSIPAPEKLEFMNRT